MAALFKMYDTLPAPQTAHAAQAAPAPAPATHAAQTARPAFQQATAPAVPSRHAVNPSLEADMARWMDTMNRLHDPLVARVVLEFMDNSAGMRDRFPGAHLLALETVKRDRMRFAKAERRKTLVLNALRYVGGLLWSGVKLATRKAPALFSATTESCTSPTSVDSVHRSLRARLQERAQQPSSTTRRG